MAGSLRPSLSFFGGAGEVTGSRHLLELASSRLLLDCGLFQGHRREALEKNRGLPFDPRALDAVLLSHVHIDHSGGLPLLAKRGLSCPVHCAPPTAELARIMLKDAAHLQVEDAKFFNKIHAAEGLSIEPLYDELDADAAVARLVEHAYGSPFAAAPGAAVTLLNAGHVLGSAMIQVDFKSAGSSRRLLFTGDLGRRRSLLMPPPKAPRNVDYLVLETTYGGRLHEDLDLAEARLRDVVRRVIAAGGKLLIPSFALERTQELVFLLEKLRREGSIPALPVYVDSPMATSISEVFKVNFRGPREKVKYLRTVAQSRALNERAGPMIIISASGMCEGGRILHHLRNNLGDPRNVVLLAGYQAAGTLGRRLRDGAATARIFGLDHPVRAGVETIDSLSAHADRADLMAFVEACKPRTIILVHGDGDQRWAFASALFEKGWTDVRLPSYGEKYFLD